AGIAGAVDFTHAAGAEGGDDFVRAELGAGWQWHLCQYATGGREDANGLLTVGREGFRNQAPRRVSARHAEACATSNLGANLHRGWNWSYATAAKNAKETGCWPGGSWSQICDEVGWRHRRQKANCKRQKAKIKERRIS